MSEFKMVRTVQQGSYDGVNWVNLGEPLDKRPPASIVEQPSSADMAEARRRADQILAAQLDIPKGYVLGDGWRLDGRLAYSPSRAGLYDLGFDRGIIRAIEVGVLVPPAQPGILAGYRLGEGWTLPPWGQARAGDYGCTEHRATPHECTGRALYGQSMTGRGACAKVAVACGALVAVPAEQRPSEPATNNGPCPNPDCDGGGPSGEWFDGSERKCDDCGVLLVCHVRDGRSTFTLAEEATAPNETVVDWSVFVPREEITEDKMGAVVAKDHPKRGEADGSPSDSTGTPATAGPTAPGEGQQASVGDDLAASLGAPAVLFVCNWCGTDGLAMPAEHVCQGTRYGADPKNMSDGRFENFAPSRRGTGPRGRDCHGMRASDYLGAEPVASTRGKPFAEREKEIIARRAAREGISIEEARKRAEADLMTVLTAEFDDVTCSDVGCRHCGLDRDRSMEDEAVLAVHRQWQGVPAGAPSCAGVEYPLHPGVSHSYSCVAAQEAAIALAKQATETQWRRNAELTAALARAETRAAEPAQGESAVHPWVQDEIDATGHWVCADCGKMNHPLRSVCINCGLNVSPHDPSFPVPGTETRAQGESKGTGQGFADILYELRSAGWMVAVHNDYRQAGGRLTFWLLTHENGRWIKGEGATDTIALREARNQARAASPAAGQAPVDEDEQLSRCGGCGTRDVVEWHEDRAPGPDDPCAWIREPGIWVFDCKRQDPREEPAELVRTKCPSCGKPCPDCDPDVVVLAPMASMSPPSEKHTGETHMASNSTYPESACLINPGNRCHHEACATLHPGAPLCADVEPEARVEQCARPPGHSGAHKSIDGLTEWSEGCWACGNCGRTSANRYARCPCRAAAGQREAAGEAAKACPSWCGPGEAGASAPTSQEDSNG